MSRALDTVLEQLGTVPPAAEVRRHLALGLARLGASEEGASPRDLEGALTAEVYRRLQVFEPAAAAKARVAGALAALRALEAAEAAEAAKGAETELGELEEGLRRFNLYFEWPEVQALRGGLASVRARRAAGEPVADALGDARARLAALEARLAGALGDQAREIEVIKGDLERARLGSDPRRRRLESLLGQIVSAQENNVLVPAEVERAGRLARELAPAGVGEERPEPTPEPATSWAARVDALLAGAAEHRGSGEGGGRLAELAGALAATRDLDGEPPPELEARLAEAENLLRLAREERTAARRVAAELRKGSRIDDLLGVFTTPRPPKG